MKILFLDIETCPITKSKPDGKYLELFTKRHTKESSLTEDELWTSTAALYAEFGRVVCVSIGLVSGSKFHVKAIASRNEKEILIRLAESIEKSQATHICAHNGKEFDFPYLRRRYIINNLPIPGLLESEGRKVWDLPFLDTMEMWSGCQWKYRVSLDLLAEIFGIPSPKTEMDGSKVADVFYGSQNVPSGELPFDAEDEAMKAIGKYCNGDVITLYKVYCRIKGYDPVTEESIVTV